MPDGGAAFRPRSAFLLPLLLPLLLVPLLAPWQAAVAQGQDSTPGERYLRIMAELLPGVYDNANQHYFDQRRALPTAQRHEPYALTIERIETPAFGETVFSWRVQRGEGDALVLEEWIVALTADAAADEVRLRRWPLPAPVRDALEYQRLSPDTLERPGDCDFLFKRRAESFRGTQRDGACQYPQPGHQSGRLVKEQNVIEVSAGDVFVTDDRFAADTGERLGGTASGEPFWLERARTFQCYVDVPGIGGGRDEAYRRYEPIAIHDKGGTHWFRTDGKNGQAARELGIALQAVTWHVLNETSGNFNRNSLVVYVMEKLADGRIKDHGYAFTEPDAERIGVNLKWMLVNCALVPAAAAKPSM